MRVALRISERTEKVCQIWNLVLMLPMHHSLQPISAAPSGTVCTRVVSNTATSTDAASNTGASFVPHLSVM